MGEAKVCKGVRAPLTECHIPNHCTDLKPEWWLWPSDLTQMMQDIEIHVISAFSTATSYLSVQEVKWEPYRSDDLTMGSYQRSRE